MPRHDRTPEPGQTQKRGRTPGKRLTDAEAAVVGRFARGWRRPHAEASFTPDGISGLYPALGYDNRKQLSRFVNQTGGMEWRKWERFLDLMMQDRATWERLTGVATPETLREMSMAAHTAYHESPVAERGSATILVP